MSTVEVPIVKAGSSYGATVSIEIPPRLKLLETGDKQPGQHCFRVLSAQHGDQRIIWDSRALEEIREAKKLFNEMVAQGLVPYVVGADGKAAEVMEEFDPGAEEVIFLPVNLVTGG